MTVTNYLDIIELNGNKLGTEEKLNTKVLIKSHPLYNDKVIIEYGAFSITVLSKDLRAAVNNSTT